MKWMKRKYMLEYPLPGAAQKADMSGVVQDKPSLADAIGEPNPDEHGVTGPQDEDPGKAVGVVPGQEQKDEALKEIQSSEKPEEEEDPQDNSDEEEVEFEEFEISLSEDSPISEEKFNELMDFVEAKNFSEEEAKQFIKMQEDAFTLSKDIVTSEIRAKAEADREALINDPLLGGSEEKFAESLKVMSKPVEAFGDEQFNELLRSDIGNNPALGRFLFNLGKAMESEGFHGKGGEFKSEKPNPLKVLYPGMFEKA